MGIIPRAPTCGHYTFHKLRYTFTPSHTLTSAIANLWGKKIASVLKSSKISVQQWTDTEQTPPQITSITILNKVCYDIRHVMNTKRLSMSPCITRSATTSARYKRQTFKWFTVYNKVSHNVRRLALAVRQLKIDFHNQIRKYYTLYPFSFSKWYNVP